jgi:hypothetical protein
MRSLIFILLVVVSAHLAHGQILRENEKKEFQFDEYKFPLFPFNPNFSEDSTWLKPERRLDGFRRQRFEVDKNLFQRHGYTRNDHLRDHVREDIYSPFDRMPCLKPYGLFRMNVLEPDLSLYNMPVR